MMTTRQERIYDHSVFLGLVTAIYPQGQQQTQNVGETTESELQIDTCTIDVEPFNNRGNLSGVKVIVPNSGSFENGAGWMPSLGATVVCAYLEGNQTYAVCLGCVYNSSYDRPSPRLIGNDYVVHHQSGVVIHIRDLEKQQQQQTPKSRAEVYIEHPKGASLVITEPAEGEVEISIKHPKGASLVMSTDGAVKLTTPESVTVESTKEVTVTSESVKILSGDIILGSGESPQGIVTSAPDGSWPLDPFTGSPIPGLPTVKAS
jgi:phage baseplate assembly protein gpV